MIVIIDPFFSKDAILRTCYGFAGNFNFEIKMKSGMYFITVAALDSTPIASDFEAEFKNALIDHELRVVIEEKTKVVKEALVCAALREAWSEPVDAK
ncbi:His-Xaa-Ser system protein HxsD [Aeromonas veronii]|uniref:His-Xaa-Ser system protein HxsD n=1 Tax=Aeromonas veronii TaxID=654 RepID=UPI003D23D7B7